MIGICIVTTFFFFIVGGLAAMAVRARLAQPRDADRRSRLLQRPVLDARGVHDLPVHHHPGVAGIANVLPLMIGAPDIAFRLNALSFWMLPMAGVFSWPAYFVPGGAFDAGWTGYAPLSTRRR